MPGGPAPKWSDGPLTKRHLWVQVNLVEVKFGGVHAGKYRMVVHQGNGQ